MGLIGNYSPLHTLCCRFATGTLGYGDRANWNKVGAEMTIGYSQHANWTKEGNPHGQNSGRAWLLPLIAGSAVARAGKMTLSGSAGGAKGRSAVAASAILLSGIAVGGSVSGASASGTITIVGNAIGSAAVSAIGYGAISITGNAISGAIASGIAAGSVTLTGVSSPLGIGHATASTLNGQGLTTQNIANAVLDSLALDHNLPDTIGAKINSAASGGVDYASLAAALRSDLGVELSAVLEVWQRLALDASKPVVNSPSAISFGAINIALSEVAGTVTASRQL